MNNPKRKPSKERTPGKGILLLGVVLTLWAAGCAHNSPRYDFGGSGAGTLVPKMTAVTMWPLAVLLTNDSAFESEITLTLGKAEPPLMLSGQLLVRGGKLRLEGTFEKAGRKPKGMGDFGVIWDEAARRGYVFSEALQGYAPITAAVRCTNVATQVMTETTERIEEHPTDRAKVTVTGSDGQTITVEETRAQDLGKLPLRIDLISGPQPFAMVLSKVVPIVPAEELFSPPDGFTKYTNQTAMLDELWARQHSTSGARHEHSSGVDSDETTPRKPRFSGAP